MRGLAMGGREQCGSLQRGPLREMGWPGLLRSLASSASDVTMPAEIEYMINAIYNCRRGRRGHRPAARAVGASGRFNRCCGEALDCARRLSKKHATLDVCRIVAGRAANRGVAVSRKQQSKPTKSRANGVKSVAKTAKRQVNGRAAAKAVSSRPGRSRSCQSGSCQSQSHSQGHFAARREIEAADFEGVDVDDRPA